MLVLAALLAPRIAAADAGSERWIPVTSGWSQPRQVSGDAELRRLIANAAKARRGRIVTTRSLTSDDAERHDAYHRVQVHDRKQPEIRSASPPQQALGFAQLDQRLWWVAHQAVLSAEILADGRVSIAPAPIDGITDDPASAPIGAAMLDVPRLLARNSCGGVDALAWSSSAERVRWCGSLLGRPLTTPVEQAWWFYGIFDVIGDAPVPSGRDLSAEQAARLARRPARALGLPSLSIGARPPTPITAAGPVWIASAGDPDLLMRVVMRCDRRASCATWALLAPRTDDDRVWIDADGLVVAMTDDETSLLWHVSERAPPRVAMVDSPTHGLQRLGDRIEIAPTARTPTAAVETDRGDEHIAQWIVAGGRRVGAIAVDHPAPHVRLVERTANGVIEVGRIDAIGPVQLVGFDHIVVAVSDRTLVTLRVGPRGPLELLTRASLCAARAC